MGSQNTSRCRFDLPYFSQIQHKFVIYLNSMGNFHMDRFKILSHALKTEVCFMIPQGWMTFMA